MPPCQLIGGGIPRPGLRGERTVGTPDHCVEVGWSLAATANGTSPKRAQPFVRISPVRATVLGSTRNDTDARRKRIRRRKQTVAGRRPVRPSLPQAREKTRLTELAER